MKSASCKARVFSGRGMQNSLGFSKASSGLALRSFIDSKLAEYLDEDAYFRIKNPLSFNVLGAGVLLRKHSVLMLQC